MIILLSVLFGIIHGMLGADTTNIVAITMVLGIVASLLGGIITGYISPGTIGSEALNGFAAG